MGRLVGPKVADEGDARWMDMLLSSPCFLSNLAFLVIYRFLPGQKRNKRIPGLTYNYCPIQSQSIRIRFEAEGTYSVHIVSNFVRTVSRASLPKVFVQLPPRRHWLFTAKSCSERLELHPWKPPCSYWTALALHLTFFYILEYFNIQLSCRAQENSIHQWAPASRIRKGDGRCI